MTCGCQIATHHLHVKNVTRAGLAANKLRFASTNTRVETQAEAMKKLREITGLNTVDEMVEEYAHLEDKHVRAMRFFRLAHDEVSDILV